MNFSIDNQTCYTLLEIISNIYLPVTGPAGVNPVLCRICFISCWGPGYDPGSGVGNQ